MARALSIPKRYESALAKIRDLEDRSAQELLAALQKLPPSTFNSDSLSTAVAGVTDTIPASDVEEMIPALLSLYTIKDATRLAAPDVAEGVALAMEQATTRQLRSSPEDRALFEGRLIELLNVRSLGIVARAGGLLFENEHSLRQTRLVTDIRPVFEQENPQAPPDGAVIVHTLKISYWDDNETKDFFVALDTNDVSELSKQLERANAKVESLKAVLEAADVRYIGAE